MYSKRKRTNIEFHFDHNIITSYGLHTYMCVYAYLPATQHDYGKSVNEEQWIWRLLYIRIILYFCGSSKLPSHSSHSDTDTRIEIANKIPPAIRCTIFSAPVIIRRGRKRWWWWWWRREKERKEGKMMVMMTPIEKNKREWKQVKKKGRERHTRNEGGEERQWRYTGV